MLDNAGADGFGLWILRETRQISTMISSSVGDNKLFEQQYVSDKLQLELILATAGRFTVAEVEEVLPAGTFEPDYVHTPDTFVDRIVKSTIHEKRIEKLTPRQRKTA